MNTTFGGFGTQGEDHMPHAVAHEVVTEPQNGDGAQAPAPAAPAVQAHVPKFTASRRRRRALSCPVLSTGTLNQVGG